VGKNVKLKVYETAGHAAHHLSFCEPLNRGLFPGDSAGAFFSEFDAVVPTTPPPFRLDLALLSLDKLISLKPEFLYYSHFGKAPNAVKLLRAYALQLKLWAKIAEEGTKNGRSPESIQEKILGEDESMRRMASHFASHSFDRKTLLENSVQGFIDFIEKQGKKE
jgi:glyoxylase-like metal-dependent hydrolase (beta-lactamase superfamily II)